MSANCVEHAGKTECEIFSARHQMQMNAGDFFVVQTPGGGYGDER